MNTTMRLAAALLALALPEARAQQLHTQVTAVPVVIAAPALGAAAIAFQQQSLTPSPVSMLPGLPSLAAPSLHTTLEPIVSQRLAAGGIQSVGAAAVAQRSESRLGAPAVSAEGSSGRLDSGIRRESRGHGKQAAVSQRARSTSDSAATLQESLQEKQEQNAPISGAYSRLSNFFDGGSQLRTLDADAVPTAQPGAQVGGAVRTTPGSGAELLRQLSHQTNRAQSRSYDDAKSALFSQIDNVVVNGVRGIYAVYSGLFIPGSGSDGTRYGERGDQDGDGYVESKGMNVEHLWPQSYFSKRTPMRSDLHHLMPTLQHPNGMRSRYPFGEVPDNAAEYKTKAGAKLGQGLFEPPDADKGRVARGMLYFYTRYMNSGEILPRNVAQFFWNSRIEMFLRWNREHPPTNLERERNDRVEKFQGNRNPFVDDPGLADRIGAEAFRMRSSGEHSSSNTVSGRSAQVPTRNRGNGRHGRHGRRR
ncbi:MAG: hypothetical protein A2X36_05485 [Elusimicrobia bacterium GWA2_69_24]|nr:MAG: hypothetical protein A2X36_05485 [Elusimicrobia bacterium GWA2_69_24]HBL16010.1 hypothetical protein [Elusimicrobiota bacterium]